MSLENLFIITKNFYYSNTYLALAIGVGLALFFFFKPKEAFKTLGVVLVFILIVYCFSILGKSSSLGMKRMINQTLDRLKLPKMSLRMRAGLVLETTVPDELPVNSCAGDTRSLFSGI